MKATEKMNDAFDLAVKEITDVLRRGKTITDFTKLASNTVSNYSRIKSTEVHEMALEVMIKKNGMRELET